MRQLVLAVVAVAAVTLVAGGSAGTAAKASLTITYWENGIGSGERVRWTLRCEPTGGTLPRAANACRRLAAGGARLFAPVPFDAICTEIYGGPQVARVVGTLAGRPVWASFNRTNGCNISRWARFSPWLLPPGGVTS
jgi:hypothetical protein